MEMENNVILRFFFYEFVKNQLQREEGEWLEE